MKVLTGLALVRRELVQLVNNVPPSGRKFAHRLSLASVTSHSLVMGYAALARLIEPAVIEPVILADPDDDAVLACAEQRQS
jgi:hypothetical protein